MIINDGISFFLGAMGMAEKTIKQRKRVLLQLVRVVCDSHVEQDIHSALLTPIEKLSRSKRRVLSNMLRPLMTQDVLIPESDNPEILAFMLRHVLRDLCHANAARLIKKDGRYKDLDKILSKASSSVVGAAAMVVQDTSQPENPGTSQPLATGLKNTVPSVWRVIKSFGLGALRMMIESLGKIFPTLTGALSSVSSWIFATCTSGPINMAGCTLAMMYVCSHINAMDLGDNPLYAIPLGIFQMACQYISPPSGSQKRHKQEKARFQEDIFHHIDQDATLTPRDKDAAKASIDETLAKYEKPRLRGTDSALYNKIQHEYKPTSKWDKEKQDMVRRVTAAINSSARVTDDVKRDAMILFMKEKILAFPQPGSRGQAQRFKNEVEDMLSSLNKR
jgi:hypothetical protein